MIKRAKKQKGNFTQISNMTLRNKELDISELGLLCLMLSFPDKWKFKTKHLVSITTLSDYKVHKLLNNLIKLGYIERKRERNGGKYAKTTYVVHEECLHQTSDVNDTGGSSWLDKLRED